MRVLVLLSGGVDSTTCLAMAVNDYGSENVEALSVFYGQRHSREIQAARDIAAYYGVDHKELDLAELFEGSGCSLLGGGEIPEESYAEQLSKTDGKPVSTYVPFRNGLFLATATTIAMVHGCSAVYYGAHRDDAAGNAYPDCSEDFNLAISEAVAEGSGGAVSIVAPLIQWNKAEVVAEGLSLGAPYHLTWSCYEGGDAPCGKCATCLDRAKAFAANGVPDPALQKGGE